MAGDMSLVHINFKDNNVEKYMKDENYGSMDLIGNILCYCKMIF